MDFDRVFFFVEMIFVKNTKPPVERLVVLCGDEMKNGDIVREVLKACP